MRKTIFVSFVIGAFFFGSVMGCSTYAVQRYAVSAANVTALRTLRGQWINVGPFTAPVETDVIDCRAAGPGQNRRR
jgi:hypothetical protein